MIESGKSLPPIPMIQKIAETLNIEPYLLFLASDEIKINEFNKIKFAKDVTNAITKQTEQIILSFLE